MRESVLARSRLLVRACCGAQETTVCAREGDMRHIGFSPMLRTNFTAGKPDDPAIAEGV